jgi:hypothetical protein
MLFERQRVNTQPSNPSYTKFFHIFHTFFFIFPWIPFQKRRVGHNINSDQHPSSVMMHIFASFSSFEKWPLNLIQSNTTKSNTLCERIWNITSIPLPFIYFPFIHLKVQLKDVQTVIMWHNVSVKLQLSNYRIQL